MQDKINNFVKETKEMTNNLLKEMLTANPWMMAFIILIKNVIFLSVFRVGNINVVLGNDSFASIGKDYLFSYYTKLLFVPHFAIALALTCFGYLFKDKKRVIFMQGMNILISLFFIFDLSYYRGTGCFIGFRHILSPELFNPTNKSIINVQPMDFIFIADIIIFFILRKIYIHIKKEIKVNRNILAFILCLTLSLGTIYRYHDIVDNKDITNGNETFIDSENWAQKYWLDNMTPLGFQAYDLYSELKEIKDEKEIQNQGMDDVTEWIENNKEDLEDNEYKGMFEGKNVIFIQVESLDSILLNNTINGQEITPNLNKIFKNSIYFNNIYEQNRESGGSSDCDLMVSTSVLPIAGGMTFFKYPNNKFTSLASLLEEKNYTTMSSHPETGIYTGGFNWSEAHNNALGFDNVYDSEDLGGGETIFLGLSDKDYLEDVKEKIKTLEKPFFNLTVTLTTHGPFNNLPEEYRYLDLPEEINGSKKENDNLLGDYFQNFRYVDEQLGKFVSDIENDETLGETVFVIYGDHSALHKYYNDRVKDVNIEEQWWKDTEAKIPLLVYTKNQKSETIDTFGGQIDIMPTIAYMMGIEREKFEDSTMGRILVNTDRNATITYSKHFYDNSIVCEIKGEVKDENEREHILKSYEISDRFIRGNYLEWLNKQS